MSVFVLRVKAWWFWFRIRARERRWLEGNDFRAGTPAEAGLPAESEPARGGAGAEAVCRQGVETVPPLF